MKGGCGKGGRGIYIQGDRNTDDTEIKGMDKVANKKEKGLKRIPWVE